MLALSTQLLQQSLRVRCLFVGKLARVSKPAKYTQKCIEEAPCCNGYVFWDRANGSLLAVSVPEVVACTSAATAATSVATAAATSVATAVTAARSCEMNYMQGIRIIS